ncbi:hypothetical protein DW094_03330 [Ruminococcaceae bacterium AM07-15]|nr:hypothetical protein DW094_03330 [Ruminococcaceae bacterium AM07-15]
MDGSFLCYDALFPPGNTDGQRVKTPRKTVVFQGDDISWRRGGLLLAAARECMIYCIKKLCAIIVLYLSTNVHSCFEVGQCRKTGY